MDENTIKRWGECRNFILEQTVKFAHDLGLAAQVYDYLGYGYELSEEDFAKACQLVEDAYASTSDGEGNDISDICYRLYDMLETEEGTLDTIKPEDLIY